VSKLETRTALAVAVALIVALIVAVIVASGSVTAAWHVMPVIWDRLAPG
jgi:hypothetical protein